MWMAHRARGSCIISSFVAVNSNIKRNLTKSSAYLGANDTPPSVSICDFADDYMVTTCKVANECQVDMLSLSSVEN